jgi:hypothetical protein
MKIETYKMRKLQLIIIAFLSLSACTVDDQIKGLKALSDCQFAIKSIGKIEVSGIDIHEIIQSGKINILGMPSLALGFLEQKIPVNGSFVIEITNPTENNAAINQFDYQILINQFEIVEGIIDQPISISAYETDLVPIEFSFDIYKFLSDDSIKNEIQKFIKLSNSQKIKDVQLTVRIKPSLLIGNQLVKYPGFIDIEKTLNSELLILR